MKYTIKVLGFGEKAKDAAVREVGQLPKTQRAVSILLADPKIEIVLIMKKKRKAKK